MIRDSAPGRPGPEDCVSPALLVGHGAVPCRREWVGRRAGRGAVAVGCLVVWVAAAWGAEAPRWDAKYEEKVGKEAAAEIDKEYDRVDNKEALAKLQEMVTTIAARTSRPEVKYQVRLVKEKKPGEKPEVNAFSLPGGTVYVTEGLLKAAQSDHELAGVLAHEIAHNAHYDGLTQAARAGKIFKGEMAAVLGAILLGGVNNDLWAGVMQAGMFYREGVLGGYSIEMERVADTSAVEYLAGTPWDPVGLLTFMERLAAEERRTGPVAQGVFQTHPLSVDRVNYLVEALDRAGIAINRRKTARWDKPTVEERPVSGKPAPVVVFQGQSILACAGSAAAPQDAKERAGKYARALAEALASGAQSYHFTTEQRDSTAVLLAYGEPIMTVEPADAALVGKPPLQVARDAQQALRNALNREVINRLYGNR